MTVLKLLRRLTRMVGLITFVRPDSAVSSPKVYGSKFKPTYNVLYLLTNPATETKSMGLPADALAVKLFAASLTKFTLT